MFPSVSILRMSIRSMPSFAILIDGCARDFRHLWFLANLTANGEHWESCWQSVILYSKNFTVDSRVAKCQLPHANSRFPNKPTWELGRQSGLWFEAMNLGTGKCCSKSEVVSPSLAPTSKSRLYVPAPALRESRMSCQGFTPNRAAYDTSSMPRKRKAALTMRFTIRITLSLSSKSFRTALAY